MHVLDASAILSAWDNYPPNQFPGLWDWVDEMIQTKELVIAEVALEEVKHKSPDCAMRLKSGDIQVLPVTSAILARANKIKGMIGVTDDRFHGKGVDENDLLIIATAQERGVGLLSDEGRQTRFPDEPRKAKIPAVCGLAGVSVHCMNFREYMILSGRVFR